MAPLTGRVEISPTHEQVGFGLVASLIAGILVSFALMFVALFGLCACCKKKRKEKEGKQEVEPPRYLEMDVAPSSKSGRKAEEAPKETSKKEAVKSLREGKKAHYVELEPPPLVPFKSEHLPERKTPTGAAAPEAKPASMKSGREEKKSLKLSGKAKETEPLPAFSVVKATGGPSSPAPVPAKAPGSDMKFAQEDDPRYKSLAQLDDVFEGTMLKASMRGASMRGKSVKRADQNTSAMSRTAVADGQSKRK